MRRRAGVIAIEDDAIALIERERGGRRYWVIPGGGVEPGESVAQAAVREAAEELGVVVRLGPVLVELFADHPPGTPSHHVYFAATPERVDIEVVGPERDAPPTSGRYRAVWVSLEALGSLDVRPPDVAAEIVRYGAGPWPDGLVIDEVAG